jgi:Spy/CpxP family protein refolding chaperone
MRTIVWSLVAALGLSAASAVAQGPPPGGAWGDAADTAGLGLTADQQARWKAVHDQLQQQNAPLRDELRQLLGGKTLRDLTPDERASLRPKIQPIMQQLRDNDRKARDQIDAMLTPEQRQKLEQRRSARRAGRRRRLD